MKQLQTFLLIFCLTFLGYMAYHNRHDVVSFFFGELKEIIQVGGVKLFVHVADTPEERMQGLSGTPSLGEFEALIFVFDDLDRHGIWMKDMNYPIDIIWVSDGLQVIHIEHDVSPDTYPKSFRPAGPARYVIETSAGLTKNANIQVGDVVILPDDILYGE